MLSDPQSERVAYTIHNGTIYTLICQFDPFHLHFVCRTPQYLDDGLKGTVVNQTTLLK